MTVIYGLYDKCGVLRYVGKANDPDKRMKSHLRDMLTRRTPLYDWMRKHGVPEMRILDSGCEDWRASERKLIEDARLSGVQLLNVADGGDQPFCSSSVRKQNGQKTAKAIHTDPSRKRLWSLHQKLGVLLKQGMVSQSARNKMRARPDLFGPWLHLI